MKKTVLADPSIERTSTTNSTDSTGTSPASNHPLMTVREAANEARVCDKTIRRWYTGPDALLKPIKVSRTVRLRRTDVYKLLGRTETELANA